MAKRKRLTDNQKLELWEKYAGRCHRCGLAIDKYKRGQLHWGHIIGLGIGGKDDSSNIAPEHARCNLESAASTETPLAAKVKRVAKRDLGIREQSRWSLTYQKAKEKGWNPWKR